MIKQSINVSQILKPITSFLDKFHIIVFFVALSVSLMVALLIIVSIINISASSASTTNEAIDSTFPQDTITQIINMDNEVPSEPGTRSNPFVEP